MEILKKGSKSNNVKLLQLALGIQVDGVFGPGTEKHVKEWQKVNSIADDGIVGPQTWNLLMEKSNLKDLDLIYDPINIHISKKANREIKYLVIHYTAGASSKKGSAASNRKVFLTREASADFCVDDESIIQVNPDPRNYYCWAVGDGKGRYGINNSDCISIEICSNLKKGTTAKVPNHEGWTFTDESIQNAIKLCKYIMTVYNIPIENVIRHYDATRKLCPGIIGWNPGMLYDSITATKTNKSNTEDKWKEFKEQLI